MKNKYRSALLYVGALVFITSCALFETEPDPAPATPITQEIKDEAPQIIKKVLVIQFVNRTNSGGTDLASFATSYVQDQVRKIPQLSLVPEVALENRLGIFSDKNTAEYQELIAQAAQQGISAIISGTIDEVTLSEEGDEVGILRKRKFKTLASLNVEIYDVTSHRLLLSKIAASEIREERWDFLVDRDTEDLIEARQKSAIIGALDKIFSDFSAYAYRIDWTGRIAKADVDRYYINGGELTGITKGQLLRVFEDSQPVMNPETKKVIGFAPGRFKGYLRVIDLFGEDGAIGVVQAGGGFREKDRLRFAFSQ